MKDLHIEREWKILRRAEQAYIKKNLHVNESKWQSKIEKYVPEKLHETLDKAFFKAFELMFEKGTGIIEKTYDKEKKENEYKVDEYANNLVNNTKSIRKFSKNASKSRNINMAISSVEGLGMGFLGMGIPDIPVFLGVLLKSIYEVALSFGFDYKSEEEKIFILKLIETALLHEESFLDANSLIDRWCSKKETFDISRKEQEKRTAKALADEMLYLKFVQGLPIVGILGGVSDVVYQKKITDYVVLKYRRRFYTKL